MTTELSLAEGGLVELITCNGDSVSILSPKPQPPGATFTITGAEVTASIKVRSCRKHGTHYQIDGRFVSLTREMRAKLLGTAQPPTDP